MPIVGFVMEESPVEEHQSNGTIEVTVREMQKQVRVMKSALEERMKCEVLSRHPIPGVSYQVGRDGRTAYELHAGKPYRRQLVEFGERVYFMAILEVQDKRNWIPSGKMGRSSASEIAVVRC